MPPAAPSPGDFIRKELESRGWTQTDLAQILDRPLPTVNRILLGKHAIMPDMAIALGMAFGTNADIWMQREATYRLSLAESPDDSVRRRARMFELAPIKEMQRRQWIATTDDPEVLEHELCRFFGIVTLDDEPGVLVATRRSKGNVQMTPQQLVWCCRARQLANALKVGQFNPVHLDKCADELRTLAGYPNEARKVATTLAKYGIRFLVIEPLQNSKIDGAACWLSPTEPVIAVSIRYDRIDAFWFTLMHEFMHIKFGDALSVDADLAGEDQVLSASKPDIEQRADRFASELLVPQKMLDSFVTRVSPLYSKARINQFAHRMQIHPGIIVGQLHYRGEIGFRANREMLVKVRDIVTSSAITDGWDHSVQGI